MKISVGKRLLLILLAGLCGGALPLRAEIGPDAGFIYLDPNAFYFHNASYFNRVALLSSPARLWHVFQPADDKPDSKPLFVFFNGGPGSATSCGLLAANTGRTAVVRDEATGAAFLIDNPSSWTRLGNILYFDARTTGFSYSLMDDPGDDDRRFREFDAQNYNAFTDGADVLRGLLRFLAAHPDIRRNPVVFVPESYGGVRTIVMLHILLNSEDYVDGTAVYQNPDLVREIRDHFAAVFPEYAGRTVPRSVIARQFGRQIMIQTVMSTPYQRSVATVLLETPGSPLYRIAEETGVPYIPYRNRPGANPNPTPADIQNYIYTYLDAAGRDAYHIGKPSGFLDGHRSATVGLLRQIDSLNRLIGTDARAIPEMYASQRVQAYKIRPTPEAELNYSSLVGPRPSCLLSGEGGLDAVFGVLQPWDTYFLNTNRDAFNAFSWNQLELGEYDLTHQTTLLFGKMFLENVVWVETFATNAANDVVVYTPALAEALGRYTGILSRAMFDSGEPKDGPRPGRILLEYRPGAVRDFSGGSRTIRFPRYPLSGHAVTMTEPEELLEDVADWLRSTRFLLPTKRGLR
jgi:hypothetical protein